MLVGFFFCIFVIILIVYDVYLFIFCIIIILCLNVNRFEGMKVIRSKSLEFFKWLIFFYKKKVI